MRKFSIHTPNVREIEMRKVSLELSETEFNVLQVAIDDMIEHCGDSAWTSDAEESETWLVRLYAAENLKNKIGGEG
tara:strand:+ start:1565 stop:1792 length:228 start_codon:yes stop_codon:yes gene_type:complete